MDDEELDQAKRQFWNQLDDSGKQQWLDFYHECQDIFNGQFDMPEPGIAVTPFRVRKNEPSTT